MMNKSDLDNNKNDELELLKIQERINNLPKHDFGIYPVKESGNDDDIKEFTGRIIITAPGHIFENVGLTLTVHFSDKFGETGEYDINIEKSYYPKDREGEIRKRESELVQLISDIIGLHLARCFYNVILTAKDKNIT